MKFMGVHHLAICTSDMKAQIDFFTQVVGLELVGLFPMHGAPGAFHSFLRMGEDSYLSFVHIPGVHIEGVEGVSHAKDGVSPVASGAMQHIAIRLETQADMLAIRDRLRSSNYAVVGPLDHGTSDSLYLGAPEGILLEFSCSEGSMPWDPAIWIDPVVAEKCGMTSEDVERYKQPAPFAASNGAVPQPDLSVAAPPSPMPRDWVAAMAGKSDEEVRRIFAFAPKEDA